MRVEATEAPSGSRERHTIRSPTPPPPSEHPLTRRELEVLAGMARGRSSREIGADLGISPRTVDAHVRHILRKLGARNRLQAVAIASRLHLIPGYNKPLQS